MTIQHTMIRKSKFILPAGLLILLFVSQATVQGHFEALFPSKRIESLLYLPKGEQLKIMSLGHRNLLADVLWMKAIGYFGGHHMTDQEYPWLYHILDQVTSLDPLFRQAYSFGGVVLSLEEGSAPQSVALLRKGMDYFPADWRLPFYIGFDYFYYFKDADKAADYIHLAAMLPGHPQYLPRLAASLLSKSGRLGAAIAFLRTVAANTADDGVRQGIERKIESLERGEIPKSLEKFLSQSEEEN